VHDPHPAAPSRPAGEAERAGARGTLHPRQADQARSGGRGARLQGDL